MEAGKGKIIGSGRPLVLSCYAMIDFVREVGIIFVDSAVLAASSRSHPRHFGGPPPISEPRSPVRSRRKNFSGLGFYKQHEIIERSHFFELGFMFRGQGTLTIAIQEITCSFGMSTGGSKGDDFFRSGAACQKSHQFPPHTGGL